MAFNARAGATPPRRGPTTHPPPPSSPLTPPFAPPPRASTAPRVASGGPDKLVLLWDLGDDQDGILAGKRGADNAATTHIKAR